VIVSPRCSRAPSETNSAISEIAPVGQWAWPRVAAVYVIVVTPGIIAFAFAQRLFFKGLVEGVLKA
jgi:ABC-type glycerol-3-phosphate transport system permease component